MDPERAAKAEKERQQKADKERVKQAHAAASSARKASAVNVKGAPTNTAVPVKLNDARDEIWSKHHARG